MSEPQGGAGMEPGRWRHVRIRLVMWWRRLLTLLRGPEPGPMPPPPPPPTPPGRLTERRPIAPFAVPARGFAFNFQVYGVFVWTSQGVHREMLNALVEQFLPYAHQHLKVMATGPARGVEPHRGEEFEGRLRRTLADLENWTYERHGLQITCRAYVRVQLDDRVRQHIRPYWERLITLDYERDLAARRARHAAGVSTQWAAVLEKLLAGPLPDAAASMTDEQLATVLKEHLAERAAESRFLADALTKLGPENEYERAGYFDLLSERHAPGTST